MKYFTELGLIRWRDSMGKSKVGWHVGQQKVARLIIQQSHSEPAIVLSIRVPGVPEPLAEAQITEYDIMTAPHRWVPFQKAVLHLKAQSGFDVGAIDRMLVANENYEQIRKFAQSVMGESPKTIHTPKPEPKKKQTIIDLEPEDAWDRWMRHFGEAMLIAGAEPDLAKAVVVKE